MVSMTVEAAALQFWIYDGAIYPLAILTMLNALFNVGILIYLITREDKKPKRGGKRE